jgi:hypothetical protein
VQPLTNSLAEGRHFEISCPIKASNPAAIGEMSMDAMRPLSTATELHRGCCAPLIAPSCEHARVLTELNQAMIVAIEAINGNKAPGRSGRITRFRVCKIERNMAVGGGNPNTVAANRCRAQF